MSDINSLDRLNMAYEYTIMSLDDTIRSDSSDTSGKNRKYLLHTYVHTRVCRIASYLFALHSKQVTIEFKIRKIVLMYPVT